MIHARGLGRRYGDKVALAGVDLDVERGELLLVTGPNGSGKTTLLRLLVGLIAPTKGNLEVAADRPDIGFLAHEPLVYRELSPLENLDLYGRLYRIRERRERTAALSRGMLQRLALCRTLLHEPRLVLLDEPFSALDPAGVDLLLGEVSRRDRGRTIVISSHQPERLGDRPTSRLSLAPA